MLIRILIALVRYNTRIFGIVFGAVAGGYEKEGAFGLGL
jgi:hypothetical protein